VGYGLALAGLTERVRDLPDEADVETPGDKLDGPGKTYKAARVRFSTAAEKLTASRSPNQAPR
jgi:hypothetical protein